MVILDNHFNPAISSQAISRCWRYGQTKPVYAYRLLTEGSMEERIVANLSKKSGLGARVVDQEYPERSFTRRELTEMRSRKTRQREAVEKYLLYYFISWIPSIVSFSFQFLVPKRHWYMTIATFEPWTCALYYATYLPFHVSVIRCL